MAWAIDLDGVIWRGADTIAGSPEAISRLRAAGEAVCFVTNNASKPAPVVAERLASIGIADADVLTAAEAAATLVAPGDRVLVVGTDGLAAPIIAAGGVVVADGDAYADPDSVDLVVCGFDETLDYRRLRTAHRAIGAGARFVAANRDVSFPAADGTTWPGNGSTAAYLAASTGVTPTFAGKPDPPTADWLVARYGTDGWVVGDRPDTDGALARACGWRFALVLSGIVTEAPVDPTPDSPAPDRVRPDRVRPDLVAPDLASAVAQALTP